MVSDTVYIVGSNKLQRFFLFQITKKNLVFFISIDPNIIYDI
jgi:hypothetical protein